MTPNEIIAAVHAEDVARARVIIHAAIEAARAQWLPVDAISDAMADEFVELIGSAPPSGTAARDTSRRPRFSPQ
jgi:hypothetical protein